MTRNFDIHLRPFYTWVIGEERILTYDSDEASHLEAACKHEGPGLAPASSQSVAECPAYQETWQLDQGLKQEVEERVARHSSHAQYNRVVQNLRECSVREELSPRKSE